jgi:Family of unknown function (DUF6868)
MSANEFLEASAKVLLRCIVLGVLVLFLWFGAFLLAADFIFKINGPLFGVSQHEMNLMHFYGIVFVKCCVLLFFVSPYIAIQMVSRKRKA